MGIGCQLSLFSDWYNGDLAYVSYTLRQLYPLRSVSLRQVIENLAKTGIRGGLYYFAGIFREFDCSKLKTTPKASASIPNLAKRIE
jgi:hypothetical protein